MTSPVKLPSCGIFIGSGIYQGQAGYLARSGRTHTAWLPQSFSPEDILDLVISENQGNLVQFWGLDGGWGFNEAPVTVARFHALEDIGIQAPLPDWEGRRNLTLKDWDTPLHYPERKGAGALKFLHAAATRGLYSILLYTDAHPDWSQRFQEVGDSYLGYDFGEIFSFRWEESRSNDQPGKAVTLEELSADLLRRIRAFIANRKAKGWGRIMATSANFYLDYEVVAGTEIPLAEDFAFAHLHMASALSRGLYRQFSLPLWGAHLAHEHYSWIPFGCEYKFPLLRAAFYHKMIAGAKMLINESGNWFLQTTKAVDSPLFEMPRVELGKISNRDPHKVAPLVKEAESLFHKVDYHSTYAKEYRRVISEFYDDMKANPAPAGQPETTVALVKGHHDLCSHEYNPNCAIAGMYTLADQDSNWLPGPPERSWEIARRTFFPRPEVLAPYPNRYLSGTPYGMVDIVSMVEDRLSGKFLSENYKAVLFSGWNTASEAQYLTLCDYVRMGGTLFLAIPHLSTNVTRNHSAYGVEELLFGGDFSELCGVKIHGRGRRFYWATAPDDKGRLGFTFPRRFGILTTCMGMMEITDPNHEVLAVDDEEMTPILILRRYGKGKVYFLNTWSYPGIFDQDYGPGATLDAPGLIGMLYQQIAQEARGSTWITDDGKRPGAECDYLSHAYFPEDGTVCLQNIDFRQAHSCWFHHLKGVTKLTLEPGEFRRFPLSSLSGEVKPEK